MTSSTIELLPGVHVATDVDGNGVHTLKTTGGSGASTVADGADVAEGALADAIVAAGAAGSTSAKLRRVTQGLEDLKTLQVQAPGENHIGQVGGNAVRLAATFLRPANATPYTAKDVVAEVTVAVTGAAAGAGGVVKLTVASHTLVTGQAVTVASVGGTTEANGNWIAQVVDATHVELLGTVFANAWTSGGTIQPMVTLLNAGRVAGGSLWIDKVRRITTDMNDIVAHRLWFYVAQPTQLADNAPFTLLIANVAKRAGYLDLPAQTTEAAGSDCTIAQNITDRLHIICAPADTSIFLVDEALTGYTPTTGATVDYYLAASQD